MSFLFAARSLLSAAIWPFFYHQKASRRISSQHVFELAVERWEMAFQSNEFSEVSVPLAKTNKSQRIEACHR